MDTSTSSLQLHEEERRGPEDDRKPCLYDKIKGKTSDTAVWTIPQPPIGTLVIGASLCTPEKAAERVARVL